jgi:hypothetical protein
LMSPIQSGRQDGAYRMWGWHSPLLGSANWPAPQTDTSSSRAHLGRELQPRWPGRTDGQF